MRRRPFVNATRSRWGHLALRILPLVATIAVLLTQTAHGQQPCPCSIWTLSTTPGAVANDTGAVELGLKFRADINGFITGLRFYKHAQNTGTHVGSLWTTSGTLLGSVTFANETASGWQRMAFASPIAVTANTTYVASYHTNTGFYAASNNGFTSAVDNAPLHALASGVSGGNGVYQYGASSIFPTQTFAASNYWVDVEFSNSLPPDTTPPTVVSTTPVAGATNVSPSASLTATFSEPVDATTVTATTVTLKNAGNTLVSASVTYSNSVATITPTTTLANSTSYTATIKGGAAGVKDPAGNALAADVVWTFTTGVAGACPCSLWTSSTIPGPVASDSGAVELGMKFRADNNGFLTGLRFYKYAQNTGTHVGSLWTSTGTLLGTVTFANETASGWQQAAFASPVAITANTTYVASYHTDVGFYATTTNGFTSAVDNGPLHGLSTGTSGGNGLYLYTAGSAFPTQSFSGSNYWVDVVFALDLAPDTTPPSVIASTPAPNATNVAITTTVKATFSEPINPATINATNVTLRNASATLVPSTVSYSNAVATLTPSAALSNSASYTATVKGGASGVKDLAGNALPTDVVWTFTTAAPATCPCSIWTLSTTPGPVVNDANAIELGLKFRTDSNGTITGLRFYKYGQNTGTHVGSLWSATGTLLGSVTFANETASGWQSATFTTPVAVTANTVYIASYHTNAGYYATTNSGLVTGVDNGPLHALANGESGANGLYVYSAGSAVPTQSFQASNYWVDVVFAGAQPPDTTVPTVAMTAPASGQSVQGTAVTVSATATDNVGVAGVQFTLDGVNLGSEVTTAPYTMIWNASAVVNGAHTLGARARDAAGNTATATVTVNVTNPDTTPPSVAMTAPAPGLQVSGNSVTVSASASDNIGVAGVQFLVDGAPLGSEVTTAPYSITWNTLGTSNGTRTLTARARDAAGNLATSAPVNVFVWNVAAITIDKVAFGDKNNAIGATVSTSAFTTTSGNELFLAFVGAANSSPSGTNTTVNSIAGGGLTWQLVVRTNTQRGTAEIWRAFAANILTNVTVTATLSHTTSSSLTVMTFTGVDTAGVNGSGAIGTTRSANAASGAPTAALTTTRNGSWVLGVGNDWDGAISRTVGPNQTMVHQLLATQTGDTYWTQRTNATTPTAGTSVTINDTAPTGNRWNLSLVEIVPPTPDTVPPAVISTSPANGTTGVSVAAILSATFSKVLNPTTISASTVQLRDASNALVPAAVGYDDATRTIVIAPAVPLANAGTYTGTFTTGIRDVPGNPLAAPFSWSFTTAPATAPNSGAGGPILVVTSPTNPFTQYYAEILRAEGFNQFATASLASVTSTLLAGYDVVILGEQTLTTAQVTTFTNWVTAGGSLIAMRPDKKLATLLGITDQNSTQTNRYLAIDTLLKPGTGLVSATIQFHGTADAYLTSSARAVAVLYSTATLATAFPAVTLNSVGMSGGQAAAFTYDLARSIVYTRQGNPAWAGQERDGSAPIRPNDLFFGAKVGDVQTDWVDLNKVAIPQADEQQRLLANLIVTMNASRKPMPRFWYFPRGEKAVVVMTGDDHGLGGTSERFDQYVAASPAGCSVDNWECVRSTSYVYPTVPLTNAQAMSYAGQGFEVSLHVTADPAQGIGCGTDFTPASLDALYNNRLSLFATKYPGIPSPATHRMHCLMWSDWMTQATTELAKGIRFDTNYYYWPDSWQQNRPGMFTGSGIPMRFAGTDGAMVDVYQAPTQMTDESGQTYPFTINSLLDNAIGASGYYGVFTANMHTDLAFSAGSDAIVASALARGVPVVSSKQMLTWLDGRNNSVFGPITWVSNTLIFSVAPGAGANGLQMMVPMQTDDLTLTGITLNGVPVTFTTQTIKGLNYAFVTVASGQYRATYAP